MSSTLVLLPHDSPPGSTEFAYAVTTDSRHLARTGRAAAALLPGASGPGGELVAVVPAAALSWHRFDWPRGVAANSPRLRAAIEGLLEEQLLDDTPALHFALEPDARPGTTAWVAVCDQAWLRGHLQALEAAGRLPHRIVPEATPEAPSALLAIGNADHPWMVLRGPSGVQRLPLEPGALELLHDLQPDTLVLAEPAVSAQAEALLQRPVVLQQAGQRWLQAAQSSWDLAQFALARSGRTRWLARWTSGVGQFLTAPAWRPARWAALALLGIQLVGLNAWAWKERQTLQSQREAVQGILTSTFPQVKVVIDAPVQMERELAALRQATGAPSASDFESLLGALAQSAGTASPSELQYDERGLRVRGISAAQREAALPGLRAQGVQARSEGDWLVLRAEAAR